MAKKTFGFEGIVERAREHKTLLDETVKKSIVIDPHLQALIPPLSTEELEQLTRNIQQEGCREPLIVWPVNNQYVLVDGHNRFAICSREGIEYKIVEKPFADRLAVEQWMILNQLGRRNLTPEQMAYFRGKRYQNEKEQGKRKDLTSGQIDQKSTATRIASEMKVGEKTIRRDARFAQGVDLIAQVEPALKAAILSGHSPFTKQSIEALSDLKGRPSAEIEQKVREITRSTDADPITTKSTTEAKPAGESANSDKEISLLRQSIHQQLDSLIRKPQSAKMKKLRSTIQLLEQKLFPQ